MRLILKSKPTIAGLALILLFSSLSFKCDSGGPPNDTNSKFRTAAKASDDIAQGISQMIDLKRKLAQQNKITPAEESVITELLLKVNTADKLFVAQIKAQRAAPDAAGKATLMNLFSQVTAALEELNSKGFLPLGSGDAKGQLAKILAMATTAAQVIQTFFNQP
jgi:hypothetical protein